MKDLGSLLVVYEAVYPFFPLQFLFALVLAWLDLIKVNPTEDVSLV